MIRVIRYIEVDEAGATEESQSFGIGGMDHDEPIRSYQTWVELQSHASFPSGKTTIDRVVRDFPFGHLQCLRYTVVDGKATDVYWFAVDVPGMPVRVETYDQDDLVHSMQMIENALPTTG